MKFDKNKVYSAANADELKVGSKVIVADNLGELRNNIKTGRYETTLCGIEDEAAMFRFNVKLASENTVFALAYLVEEAPKLKWTDLKIGDSITNDGITAMVTVIDSMDSRHIFANTWLTDKDLEDWEKV